MIQMATFKYDMNAFKAFTKFSSTERDKDITSQSFILLTKKSHVIDHFCSIEHT